MSHRNKRSLVRQIQDVYDSKLAIGESKHQDKINGTASGKIYSWSTYSTYLRHANYFGAWCKEQHGCKTLDDCRPYVKEWMDSRSNLSAYTRKMEVCALGKLYGCKSEDFGVDTGHRVRADITRSRLDAVRDSHFSYERNSDLVDFCRSTGARRRELSCLTGDKLIERDGQYFVRFDVGTKGGRVREAPVIGNVDLVVRYMRSAGSELVFPHISSACDIHSFRADYCTALYKMTAREIRDIPYDRVNQGSGRLYQSDVYYCRGELKGIALDKKAMNVCSEALGHSRNEIISRHYVRIEEL